MKKMILLFSHKLTNMQKEDAKISFGIEEFIVLPNDLQNIWSNIPPTLEDLDEYLKPVRDYLRDELRRGDIALVQGDFGATCAISSFVKAIEGTAVYATTKRDVVEKEIAGKIVSTSVFEHIRYREF